VKMVNVNYSAEAGLYHRVIGGWKSAPLGYKRFRTAAGAIRFAPLLGPFVLPSSNCQRSFCLVLPWK